MEEVLEILGEPDDRPIDEATLVQSSTIPKDPLKNIKLLNGEKHQDGHTLKEAYDAEKLERYGNRRN